VGDEPEHNYPPRLDLAVPDLNYPDLCVFDLDPSKDDAKSVRGAAVGLRDLLEKLGCRRGSRRPAERVSHRGADRRQDACRGRRSIRQRGGHLLRQPGARSAHAGVQQGRSARPDLHRHGP
jgi:hypothetical protein